MRAGIGTPRALHRQVQRVSDPARKHPHRGRRKPSRSNDGSPLIRLRRHGLQTSSSASLVPRRYLDDNSELPLLIETAGIGVNRLGFANKMLIAGKILRE
jgi:hypothetical protein